ncbi:hypothetical protein SADUNF_Sadunf10G0123500 [Salix dunnii]|uniref:Uncharacterized protein n=1 Tax=Salix dunnii TaxID=1413687 RepID=A0A835JSH9_9ROSI|nr:hypothetical protein SADUNF_Sadunf10G0123500 [Salix dunnii]
MANLGSELYMQADVSDTQRIFVDVGLGFHVGFTWSEALNFIALREEKGARFVRGFGSDSNCRQINQSSPELVFNIDDPKLYGYHFPIFHDLQSRETLESDVQESEKQDSCSEDKFDLDASPLVFTSASCPFSSAADLTYIC